MPSLLDFRRRIRTVRNTQQLTKAMKMISAAKLRKTQERVVAARPYASHLRELLAGLATAARSTQDELELPLLDERSENNIQVIAITSDRGLAGAFNSNINRGVRQFIADKPHQRIQIEAIGRKGRDFYTKYRLPLSGEHIGITQKVKYADAKRIAELVTERYIQQEVDSVYLVYNEFRGMMAQRITVSQLLPIEMPEQQAGTSVDYILEQEPQQMLESLLPRYIEVSLYQAMLESEASEHAARMTAMDAATTNAGDLIDKLTLHMNRVRQASITKEIIEVVSGAAAIT